jgi:mannitol/fructose-specific phosphotransferase system IIA component (Ntr-type)
MRLRDFFDHRSVSLDLKGGSKDEVLGEMIALLGIDERSHSTILRLLQRREQLGSTGIGRGVAVPHCRTLAVGRIRLAFGRHGAGIEFNAIDHRPVHSVFLIIAPPAEVANQYLPVLGKIAQLAKDSDTPERLAKLTTVDEFFALLDQKAA